jgi:hypothetical protein
MLLYLIPKIPYILSGREKGKTPLLPWKGSTNTTYERPERVIQKGISEFFLKTYKNSRMKVD